MNNPTTYHLPDEPRASLLAANVASPLWPFLAFMLVGAWFGLAWFLFNSLALGSPTWRREIAIAALALVGSVILLLALEAAGRQGWLDERALRYAALSVVCLRLGCAYALNILQERVYELHQYFGGNSRNGALVLVGAMFIARPAVAPLLGNSLLAAVLQ